MKTNLSVLFSSRWQFTSTLVLLLLLLVGAGVAVNWGTTPSNTETADAQPAPLKVVSPDELQGAATTLHSSPTPGVGCRRVESAMQYEGVPDPESSMVLTDASSSVAGSTKAQNAAAETVFQYPLVFVPINPEALTPTIQAAVTQLQKEFVEAIGDTQDPNDPAYQQRWLEAQRKADASFRVMFGWMAFNEMQLGRAQEAYLQLRSQHSSNP